MTIKSKHKQTKTSKDVSPCRRMSAKDRKTQILKTTRELIFAEGTSRFTLKRIARSIGITEAAVYRHFTTKEDVMLSLLSSMFDPWKLALDKLIKDKMPEQYKILILGRIHLHYLLNAKVNPLLFFSDALNPEQAQLKIKLQENLEFITKTIKSILIECANNEIFDTSINVDDIQRCILGILQCAVIKLTIFNSDKLLSEEVEQTLTTLLESIKIDLSNKSVHMKNYKRFTK